MKNFVIQKNDANKRIDRFLGKTFKNASKILIYKLIRKKQIKVNGKRIEPNYQLQLGDKVSIFNNILYLENNKTDFLKAGDQLNIVYDDENILVVNKPVNLAVQPDASPDSLQSRIQKYLYESGEYDPNDAYSFTPSIAHRIDQNTTGLVIAAKNSEALRVLNELFRQHNIKKTYLTLVHGLIQTSGTIKNWILKGDKFVKVLDHAERDAKPAITHYEFLRIVKGKYTLLKINLETGRTHQIRATMNDIGYPIVGEKKYTKPGIDHDTRFHSQALVATEITFQIYDHDNPLFYLNGKTIHLPLKDQPFWVNW